MWSGICEWRGAAVVPGGTKSRGRDGWAGGWSPDNRCTFLGASSLPLSWWPRPLSGQTHWRSGRAMTFGALLLLLGVLGAPLAPGKSVWAPKRQRQEQWSRPATRGSLRAFLRQVPAARKPKADCLRNFSRTMITRCGPRGRWETASASASASHWRSSSAW